jgi:hypothetical protein
LPIDILAQIGFVVLLGLAAKNAILIVEFAKQRQDHDGVDPQEAAVHSARVRLRPILMTSIAFIAGVGPLTVAHGAGAEMRQSLGTTVFFGMLGVTIFGLLFTPAFYALVRKRKSKVKTDRKTHASSLTTTVGLILPLSMFLQGCSVGPKYKVPPPPRVEFAPFHNKLEVPNSRDTPAPSLDEWWKGFKDPMLVTIVQREIWVRFPAMIQLLEGTFTNTQLDRPQAGSSMWRAGSGITQRPLEMKCKPLRRTGSALVLSSPLTLPTPICRSVAIRPESQLRKAR